MDLSDRAFPQDDLLREVQSGDEETQSVSATYYWRCAASLQLNDGHRVVVAAVVGWWNDSFSQFVQGQQCGDDFT